MIQQMQRYTIVKNDVIRFFYLSRIWHLQWRPLVTKHIYDQFTVTFTWLYVERQRVPNMFSYSAIDNGFIIITSE